MFWANLLIFLFGKIYLSLFKQRIENVNFICSYEIKLKWYLYLSVYPIFYNSSNVKVWEFLITFF